MIRPNPLKKGDNVGYIATSGPIVMERLESAVEALENHGLNVILGESCTLKRGYLAGDDEKRAKDINEMFQNDNIKGIFVMRGGYGCARLLDKIDYDIIKSNPKPFFGYSDVTMLHIVFNQLCNMITYHAPMPATELYKSVDKFTLNSYQKMLFSPEIKGEVYNPRNMNIQSLVPGKAYGQLIGGNLSLICSSLGTKYEIDTKDKILFIEEVSEEPYKIDRMLVQLIQADKIKDCKGIIFGYFSNCEPTNIKKSLTLDKILEDLILPTKKPCITNLACGHDLPTLSLPMGADVLLDSKNKSIKII